jgi:hypothetical protein
MAAGGDDNSEEIAVYPQNLRVFSVGFGLPAGVKALINDEELGARAVGFAREFSW